MDATWTLLAESLPDILPALGVAGLLGYVGSHAVPMVRRLPPSRWTRLYLLTDWLHPIFIGAAFGLSPHLPVPAFWGDSWEASIIWYALAGVVSLPVYRRLMRRLKVGKLDNAKNWPGGGAP